MTEQDAFATSTTGLQEVSSQPDVRLHDGDSQNLGMAHCHIADHAESGMMFNFNVARTLEPVR
jgi:FtsP/CotA-like multicopper oxidase with cupredoxin domain